VPWILREVISFGTLHHAEIISKAEVRNQILHVAEVFVERLHHLLIESQFITLEEVQSEGADGCEKNWIRYRVTHDDDQVKDDGVLKDLHAFTRTKKASEGDDLSG
jgi:hypothetical protein